MSVGPGSGKKDYTLSICNYGNRSSETPWQKKAIKISKDLKDAKKRIKELEKELNRKDKALAEMAALVALKKKLHHILEDSEDD
jgi:hypothetical protein